MVDDEVGNNKKNGKAANKKKTYNVA